MNGIDLPKKLQHFGPFFLFADGTNIRKTQQVQTADVWYRHSNKKLTYRSRWIFSLANVEILHILVDQTLSYAAATPEAAWSQFLEASDNKK